MPTLRSLDRRFAPLAERFFEQVARPTVPGIIVTSARRTFQEQAALYRAYLRGENNGLPAVPPGTSDHELGLAFDLARPGHDPFTDPYLADLGPLWRTYFGGEWSSSDPVHFGAPRTVLAAGRRHRGRGRAFRSRRGRRRRS